MQTTTAAETHTPLPYVRLSAYYFAFFGVLGVFLPYWPLFLHQERGFSAAEIGELMAVSMCTRVVAPLVWGWLADHGGQRLRLIRLAGLLSVLCFLGNYLGSSLGWTLLVMAAFGFFWNAGLPQFEALTFNHLGSQINRYSRIRVWGSVGFIVSVLTLPYLLEHFGNGRIPEAMLFLFTGLWISTLLVTDKVQTTSHTQSDTSLWPILRQPAVWALLLACMLQQASHGPYYNFFSLYLEQHGYSRQVTGSMWALGVASEVVLFVFMYRLIQGVGAARLFMLAMLLTSVRWTALAYGVDTLWALLLVQVLHAATFGLYHASGIYLIHHWFPGKLQGRGQALYSGLGGGIGSALGSLLSGYAWDSLGAVYTLLFAALTAGVAALLALLFVREASHATA